MTERELMNFLTVEKNNNIKLPTNMRSAGKFSEPVPTTFSFKFQDSKIIKSDTKGYQVVKKVRK